MTYSKNIGIMEMIQFSQTANKAQQKQMNKIVATENWAEYKKIINTVLNINLK